MKTFKEYINEAKLARKKATDLKVGDVIQGNVQSAKDLNKTWGVVKSIKNEGRDVIIKVNHVEFPNGNEKKLGTSEEINALNRQVFAVRVE